MSKPSKQAEQIAPEAARPGRVRRSLSYLFNPGFIQEWRAIWKERGFRGFVREKGWRIVAAIILYYLVRDSLLYLVLPYLAARGLLKC